MERNKRGISLIVLVITIIVMIILAGAVIISLGNAGIIGKSQEAVDANNLKQVQQLASLIWSEEYLSQMENGKIDEAELIENVTQKLNDEGITNDKYIVNVTANGVNVNQITTLGALINGGDDYGKTIDYTVTTELSRTTYDDVQSEYITESRNVTLDKWQILYEDETNGYVFIISSKPADSEVQLESLKVENLSVAEKELYSKFQVGNWPKYTLTDDYGNSRCVANLIRRYGGFANKDKYGADYVIGSIGGPTLELLAASWNAQIKTPIMTLTTDEYGYKINGEYALSFSVTSDDFLIPLNSYWLASPSAAVEYAAGASVCCVSSSWVGSAETAAQMNIHPVVCLSSNIPAYEGDEVDFSLVQQGE